MNPLGSSSPYDLFDNAQNFDTAVNSLTEAIWLDRLGRKRHSWYGIESLALNSMRNYGYITKKSFELGAALDTPNTVLQWEGNGEYYRWDGIFPKVVPPGSTPESAGGVGAGKWVSVGDAALRGDLVKPEGASVIGEKDGGSVQGKLDSIASAVATDRISLYRYKLLTTLPLTPPLVASVVAANGYSYLYPQAFSYGRNGDIFINFASNDQLATWVVKFNAAGIAVSIFKALDGISEVTNFYTNAGADYYVVGLKGVLRKFNVTKLPAGESIQTPVSAMTPDVYFGGCGYDNERMLLEEWATPLGTVTRRNRLFVYNMATGLREQAVTLPFQIVGAASGSPYDTVTHKTQGFKATKGGIYLSHGKKASGTETDINHATGVSFCNWQGNAVATATISAKTMFDFLVSQGLAPTRVENEGVTIGHNGFPNVLHVYLDSTDPHATSNGIAISSVGEPFDYVDLSDGAIAPLSATYYGKSKDGLRNPYTGEVMDSMAKILDYMIATDTQEFNFYTGTVTVADLDGLAFPGSTMVRIYNQNNATFFYETVNGGVQSWWLASGSPLAKSYVSFIGAGPKADLTNTIAGSGSGRKLTTGNSNALYGAQCAQEITTGVGVTAFGQNAGRGTTTAVNSSYFGRASGWYQLDGVTPNNYDYCSTLGYGAMVSGEKQIQLGNPGTTTYVYGTIQNRSDIRDKTDTRDTLLGIDFIMGLRPVDGRWDLRDAYFDEVCDGVDEEGKPQIRFEPVVRDGSRKGERFHHWFIAQEVKELCDKLGVDFGGFQDHKINGGNDVLSLGYDEFIPPTVRAVQQCWKRMDDIEARLKKLEG